MTDGQPWPERNPGRCLAPAANSSVSLVAGETDINVLTASKAINKTKQECKQQLKKEVFRLYNTFIYLHFVPRTF